MATWYVHEAAVPAAMASRLPRHHATLPPNPPQRSSHRERLRAELKLQLVDLITSANPHAVLGSTVVTTASGSDTDVAQQEKLALDVALENYLAVTPHERKFQFATSVEVFQKGLFLVPFNPDAFQMAWENLAQYAANLLSHSWRPEYKTVKLYSGFYRHFVEAALPESYRMFALMGYSMVLGENNSVLRITGPFNFDMILGVYLDCLIASAECRVMLQILEKLSDLPVSWYQIVAVREKYVCGADSAADVLRQDFVEAELASSLKNQMDLRCDDCFRPVPPQRRQKPKANRSPPDHDYVHASQRSRQVHNHQQQLNNEENEYALRPGTLDDHSEASWNLVKDANMVKGRILQPVRSPVSREASPSAESWSYVYDALNNGSTATKLEKVVLPSAPAKPVKNNEFSKRKISANSVANKEPSGKWPCKACTYLNSKSARICAMCAKTRAHQEEAKISDDVELASSNGLECPKCTYINAEDANECAMCLETFD